MTAEPRLIVRDLVKHYRTRAGVVAAVDGVSFEVPAGETLALVGESGCGKSTVANTVLGLTARNRGTITFPAHPRDDGGRSGRVGIVFQNPYSSLNPRMRVHDLIAEALVQAGCSGRKAISEAVTRHLEEVGLGPQHARRFAHEFSGGQRQRIAIARALALDPDILVLDEPTAALDVSVQAQILNLLIDLQDRRGLSYLLISHNLATVESIAHEVMVMYFGRIVERGPVAKVFWDAAHPYTRALLRAIPSLNPRKRDELTPLGGAVPSFLDPPPGCAFAPRCHNVGPGCEAQRPPLEPIDGEREAACFYPVCAAARA